MTTPVTVPIRMISFVGDGVFSSVVDSQVVVPLRVIGQVAPTVQRAMLMLTSSRHRGNPKAAARQDAMRAALPGAAALFRFRPLLLLPFQACVWARRLRSALEDCGYCGPAPIVVHCRGTEPAAAAALLKRRDPRLRILLDMRGDPIDEVSRRGLLSWYLRYTGEKKLRLAFGSADALNTVSHKLAEHLQRVGLLTRALPRSVIGCCVDTERFTFDPAVRAARRQELGLDGRFVVCYCGSMARYQRPDAVADAFAAIQRNMPDAHLLVVSGEAQPLVEELQRRGIRGGSFTVRSAPHDQVAACLMAADIGLLLRENIMTNRVASPVKFAEYLRCGLPVILTHYVGDFAALVAAENVGQAVEFPVSADEVVQAARRLRQELAAGGDDYRRRCSRVAEQRLSWSGQIGGLLAVYETLVRG